MPVVLAIRTKRSEQSLQNETKGRYFTRLVLSRNPDQGWLIRNLIHDGKRHSKLQAHNSE